MACVRRSVVWGKHVLLLNILLQLPNEITLVCYDACMCEIHYHHGLCSAPVRGNDCRCAADDCSSQRSRDAAATAIRILWMFLTNMLHHLRLSQNIHISGNHSQNTQFIRFVCGLSDYSTLLLYCLAQCGQHTGAVAMVPVSWVCVLSMGSGSPGPAGRSFRMLGGNSAPGWFFRM